jgi:hypothetical protein
MNVISQSTSATVKLSTIAQICKYKRLHEGHHFISMAMYVHVLLGVTWIVSSKNAPIFA